MHVRRLLRPAGAGVTLLVLALAAGEVAAQGRRFPDGPPSDPRAAAVPPRAVRVESPVDVPMLLVSGLPAVEVWIEGEGPYRFGIETGAPFVAVKRRVLDRLPPSRTDAAGVTRAERLRIGGAVLEGVVLAETRLGDPMLDGILGLNAFHDLLLTLDYPAGRVRIERGRLEAANGGDRLATVALGPFVGIRVVADGRPLVALIDTRSVGGFHVPPTEGDSLRFVSAPIVTGFAQGPSIGSYPVRTARLDGDLRIGQWTVERPLVGIRPVPAPLPQTAVLGNALLRSFVVTLDQASGVVRLANPDGLRIPPTPPLRSLGFRVRLEPGGTLRIAEVTPNSAAARAGLLAEDQVMEVDGRPAHEIGPSEWPRLAERTGAVTVVVSRAGARYALAVAPEIVVP